MTTEHHSTVRRYLRCICLLSHAIPTLSQQHYWPASEACITQGSLHLTCLTTGGVSVLIDMNLAHIVFFKRCRNTPLSRERLQNSCSKMAASATTTRISHISVISLHGSVAGSGSCCTGCVTSHGRRDRRGQL